MPQLFVNLAVTDLDVAKEFYTAIGFTLNPAFSDHNVACFVIDADHNYVMVHTREFYQTFTELTLGDPAVNPTSSIAVFLDSKAAVDAAVEAGLAAGGTQPGDAADYGFMYQRPLTDPSGNILDFGWMDPVAAEQGPPAN
jgi:uncharacterized protein